MHAEGFLATGSGAFCGQGSALAVAAKRRPDGHGRRSCALRIVAEHASWTWTWPKAVGANVTIARRPPSNTV